MINARIIHVVVIYFVVVVESIDDADCGGQEHICDVCGLWYRMAISAVEIILYWKLLFFWAHGIGRTAVVNDLQHIDCMRNKNNDKLLGTRLETKWYTTHSCTVLREAVNEQKLAKSVSCIRGRRMWELQQICCTMWTIYCVCVYYHQCRVDLHSAHNAGILLSSFWYVGSFTFIRQVTPYFFGWNIKAHTVCAVKQANILKYLV